MENGKKTGCRQDNLPPSAGYADRSLLLPMCREERIINTPIATRAIPWGSSPKGGYSITYIPFSRTKIPIIPPIIVTACIVKKLLIDKREKGLGE
jgi:hypothetical protein